MCITSIGLYFSSKYTKASVSSLFTLIVCSCVLCLLPATVTAVNQNWGSAVYIWITEERVTTCFRARNLLINQNNVSHRVMRYVLSPEFCRVKFHKTWIPFKFRLSSCPWIGVGILSRNQEFMVRIDVALLRSISLGLIVWKQYWFV